MKRGCALVGLDYLILMELLIARDSHFPIRTGTFSGQVVMLGLTDGGWPGVVCGLLSYQGTRKVAADF